MSLHGATGKEASSSSCVGRRSFGAIVLVSMVAFVVALGVGAGIDWFLAAILAVVTVILFVVNTYLVVKWADPKDQAATARLTLLIIVCLTVAEGAILGLPLDVSNNSNSLDCSNEWGDTSECGNMNMLVFWQSMMILIFVLVAFAIPMAIFFYEAYDEVEIGGKRTGTQGAFTTAICYEFVVLAATFTILGLMWAFLGTAQVPVTELTVSITDLAVQATNFSTPTGRQLFVGNSQPLTDDDACLSGCVSSQDSNLEISTSFATYIAAFTGWVGWFVFALFGGVGLAVVPFDLITAYMRRPRLRDAGELARMKQDLQQRTKYLVGLGEDIKKERQEWNSRKHNWRERSKKRAADRTNVNKFKQMVYLLEKDFDEWNISSKNVLDYNPLAPYVSLALGILAAILTLLWFLQLVLYVLVDPPISQFLNLYFMQFDEWFPLFGVLSVAMFSFYLLVCVTFGLFKLGVRCFCVSLHPMEYGKTLVNSFLFNVLWILLCSIPVVQFCTQAFDTYARYTTIGSLLGVQVRYLEFFRYFFEDDVFIYIILVLMGLTFIYLAVYSKDKPPSAQELKGQLRK